MNSKIIIKGLTLEDAPGLIEYMKKIGSESDNLTFDGSIQISLEDEKKWLERKLNDSHSYLVAAFSDERIVGLLDFSSNGKKPRIAHCGEFGLSVLKDFWGHGIGTTLMHLMLDWAKGHGIRKINLLCREDNVKAVELYKKMGFSVEGHDLRMFCIDGRFINGVRMGLLIDGDDQQSLVKTRHMTYDSRTNRIETERLVLRNVVASDLNDFFFFASNPDVGPRAGWNPHKSIEESRGLLQMFTVHPHYFAITLKGEDRFLGSIEAMPVRDNEFPGQMKEIGFVLGKDEWGKGYMTEACNAVVDFCFAALGCRILFCSYFEPNEASANVQRKCGFRCDGRTRMFTHWLDGTVCDKVNNSLSYEDWKLSKN
jgi:RimJ/RimL family protein N-acetyltransferase